MGNGKIIERLIDADFFRASAAVVTAKKQRDNDVHARAHAREQIWPTMRAIDRYSTIARPV